MAQFYIKNGLVHGQVTGNSDTGFRYMPFTSARRSSRKSWPSAEDAIKGRVPDGGRLIDAVSAKEAVFLAQADKERQLAVAENRVL